MPNCLGKRWPLLQSKQVRKIVSFFYLWKKEYENLFLDRWSRRQLRPCRGRPYRFHGCPTDGRRVCPGTVLLRCRRILASKFRWSYHSASLRYVENNIEWNWKTLLKRFFSNPINQSINQLTLCLISCDIDQSTNQLMHLILHCCAMLSINQSTIEVVLCCTKHSQWSNQSKRSSFDALDFFIRIVWFEILRSKRYQRDRHRRMHFRGSEIPIRPVVPLRFSRLPQRNRRISQQAADSRTHLVAPDERCRHHTGISASRHRPAGRGISQQSPDVGQFGVRGPIRLRESRPCCPIQREFFFSADKNLWETVKFIRHVIFSRHHCLEKPSNSSAILRFHLPIGGWNFLFILNFSRLVMIFFCVSWQLDVKDSQKAGTELVKAKLDELHAFLQACMHVAGRKNVERAESLSNFHAFDIFRAATGETLECLRVLGLWPTYRVSFEHNWLPSELR